MHWTNLFPRQKRIDIESHVNVRWYLCFLTTVLFDELKQVSIPISIDGCASQLNVKSCDCTIFGTGY